MVRRIAALVLCATVGTIAPARADVFTVTTLGNPTFSVVDLHLFSATIGTAASGYAEFLQTGAKVLPEPYYKLDPVLGVTPDQPHPGATFTTDIANGVLANGFVDKSTFAANEFSNGQGVFLFYMVVPGPNAPTGSTLDYASGPVIPNTGFPITQTFDTFYRDIGGLADSSGAFTVPVIHPSLTGESHVPFFDADNFDFMDPSKGIAHLYEYRIRLTDAQGNGYQILADFQVVPEPSVLVLSGVFLPLAVLISWRRSR